MHMLSLLVRSEILHGLLEGFSTPVLEHALTQAGDANVAEVCFLFIRWTVRLTDADVEGLGEGSIH